MNKTKLLSELQFKAVRSSGAGGQHVNKVASKVELTFDIVSSIGLSEAEKERLLQKMASRLTNDGILILQCDEARSQYQNKKLVIERFFKVLEKALHISKKRKPTKPSKSSVEKRLKFKQKLSDKKSNRKKPDF